MSVIFGIYAFMLGAAIGSFCNMLFYRIKRRQGLGGFSFCDKTGKRLIWKDLIPMVSYIIYKGKCRECGEKLPIKYPLVEFIMGLIFLAISLYFLA